MWIVYYSIPSNDKGKLSNWEFSSYLLDAAYQFSQVGLYVSAVIAYLKFISYWTMVLDFFTADSIDTSEPPIDNSKIPIKTIESIFSTIQGAAKACVKCISLARQLDTSQFAKTFVVRDQPEGLDQDYLTDLFDKLISGVDEGNSSSEVISWQQSLWAHKLAGVLCWSNFVKNKLLTNTRPIITPCPNIISSLSIRPGILIRWVFARDCINNVFSKKLIYVDGEKILFKLTQCIEDINNKNTIFTSRDLPEMISNYIKNNSDLKALYSASRYLYFSIQEIRLISRKNSDLIFPFMCHVYHSQWKLLSNLVMLHIIEDLFSEISKIKPLRHYALKVQRQLIAIDEKINDSQTIPPTHFDYEDIYIKVRSNLTETININDSSTRTCSNILQQKYYCDDDHGDPEFRMDWTLVHMFSPSSKYLSDNVEEVHDFFLSIETKLNSRV